VIRAVQLSDSSIVISWRHLWERIVLQFYSPWQKVDGTDQIKGY